MYLKRFIYVNWGNLPNQEFDFGPVNLFSGGNGSGKTTAADAIQTVMTAAHENLFQFNPGQDETTQRGRGGKRVRTLASYVLGCDDGSYSRLDPSDGYLAAIFHPTQGENADPFTALIAVRAWLDQSGNQASAKQDECVFFVLPGIELKLDHLQREDAGGRYVTSLDHLPTLLASEFGKRSVERFDTKKSYLRRLYAALRGKTEQVTEHEAVAAARAFSRFMAYKPVSSINQFVAEEILERRDMGEAIRTVSGQLKTIHAMEREARALVEGIALLDDAATHAQSYIESWLELTTLDYTIARHDALARHQDYLHSKQEQTHLQQQLSEIDSDLESNTQLKAQTHEQRVQLEAQRQGVSALRQKDEYEQQREQGHQQLSELGKDLLLQDNQVQNNSGHIRLIHDGLQTPELRAEAPSLTDMDSIALAREALEQGQRADLDLSLLQQQDLTNDLSAFEQKLQQTRSAQRVQNRLIAYWNAGDDENPRPRDQLQSLHSERRRRYENLDEQKRRKRSEIERLQSQQVNYPAYVERALSAIRAQCPQADPRVLCDHIEVSDERWQAAIEGYMGGARFNILVEADYEAEAIRIVRNLPGRDNRARVIQGSLAGKDAARSQLESNSIVHVLNFSHAVARDFLTASYGSVLRVDSADALRHTRRGITSDGMGSSSYSMFRCDISDADLVFGASARERALRARETELLQVETECHQAAGLMQQSAQLLSAVDALKPVSHADTIHDIISLRREIVRLDALIDSLDLSEHEDLENRLQALKQENARLEARLGELNTEKGKVSEKLERLDQLIKELANRHEQATEQAESCEQAVWDLQAHWPDFDPESQLQQADTEAPNLSRKLALEQRENTEKTLHKAERLLDDLIQQHNQQCRPGDAIYHPGFEGDYDLRLFKHICGVRKDLDRVYNLLKNNILVDKHKELKNLKESFNSTFVTHLCHQIHQAIKDGERQIDLLNRELQHHRFGADRETFRFASEWVPEYRDYARFFDEVMKIPSLGEETQLFTADLTSKSQQVRDELMRLLLEEDEQRAQRELERVADYRHYRRYEIFKEVEGKQPIPLSEYGTGSGGQLETPAYIIRSAAITSAFRFAEGQNHLRMVLVDEAFMHMDEQRSREVIGYLTEALGLQLVFIMPTSKCGPFMDLISNEFIFAKVPSMQPRGQLNTRVLIDRKIGNQEKIGELWAQHRRSIYQQAELDFMDDVLEGS